MALGLERSHRWCVLSLGCAYSADSVPFDCQGLKFGRCAAASRPPSAGGTRKGRNQEKSALSQQKYRRTKLLFSWYGTRFSARPENRRRASLVSQGRFLGGNALSDSFPHFSSGRNGAQRSVPTGGAGFRRGNRRREHVLSKLENSKKVRPAFADRTFLWFQV